MRRLSMRLIALLLAVLVLLRLTASGQIHVTDDHNRRVTLTAPARHIVSLAPSITEILFAVGAGDQVAGVTDYCTAPEEARTRVHIGGMVNPSIEAIVQLQPDLVIMSMEGNSRQDFDRLTGLGLTVFVSNPRSLEGIRTSMLQLGALTGHQAEAAGCARLMKDQEDSLCARIPAHHPRVALAVSLQPLILAGTKTFLGDILTRAGADNIGSRIPGTYPAVSRETLAAADPEVLLLMSDAGLSPRDAVRLFPEWSRVTAVRTGRVFVVNADLVSRPGPRAVAGLAHLLHLIHSGHP